MILKLAPNVPMRLAIKYIDAVPPSDPKYGPQARLKTDTNDLLYLPGKATDAFNELQRAGVIAAPPTSLPATPGEKMVGVQVTAAAKDVTVTLEQQAGDKYGHVRIAAGNGTPVAQAQPHVAQPSYSSPSGQAPKNVETGAPPAAAAAGAYDNPLYLSIVQFVRDGVMPLSEGLVGEQNFAAIVNTIFIQETRK